MQREGVFREMKRRRFYEKPSEDWNREKAEAIRRARKLARKKAQREGLIAACTPSTPPRLPLEPHFRYDAADRPTLILLRLPSPRQLRPQGPIALHRRPPGVPPMAQISLVPS